MPFLQLKKVKRFNFFEWIFLFKIISIYLRLKYRFEKLLRNSDFVCANVLLLNVKNRLPIYLSKKM
jgi:hypothetical protein